MRTRGFGRRADRKLSANIRDCAGRPQFPAKDRPYTPNNLPRRDEDRRAGICALDLRANFLREVLQRIGASEDQVDYFRRDA